MASDDAAMDVEMDVEEKDETEETKEEPEEAKVELDPIAIMEAKLQRITELTETDDEELSEKILEATDVLAEIVETDDKYVSPDEVKSIIKFYELDPEKYESLLSEAGIEDADPEDGIRQEQLNEVLVVIWPLAIEHLNKQIKLAKLPRTILSAEQVEAVWNAKSTDAALELLASMLKLKNFRTHTRNGIKSDFFYYHLDHCKNLKFDPFKAAVFVTVMDNVFICAENSGWQSSSPAFEVFKAGMLEHCIAEAGPEYEGFTPADVASLTKYIARTFFRYFHAFKFAFTRQPQVKNVCRVVAVEQPIAKTGMAEATAAETSS